MSISNDKAALVKSMNNLVNHITSSREAQEQIFNSLDKKDFDKIISNLTDHALQLRLTSARLIGQLLQDSENLQIKFCTVMGVHYSSESEIIVNNNLDRILQAYPQRVPEMFKLMKAHHKIRLNYFKKIGALLWFINPQKESMSIEYLSQDQIIELIKNIHQLNNPEEVTFDPSYCIFGVLTDVGNSHLKNTSTLNTQLNQSREMGNRVNQQTHAPRTNQQAYQPKYFQPYVPRTVKVSNYPQVPIAAFPFPKLNLDRLQSGSSVNTPLNTDRLPFENKTTPLKMNSPNRKISLTETFKTQYPTQGQSTINSAFYTPSENQNKVVTDRLMLSPKYRPVTEISKSSHLYDSYDREQPFSNYSSTAVKNSHYLPAPAYVPDSHSYSLLAPSLKVKNIAMNGRQGWQTAKNAKPQTPSPHSGLLL